MLAGADDDAVILTLYTLHIFLPALAPLCQRANALIHPMNILYHDYKFEEYIAASVIASALIRARGF
jgi:hypothetical protein